MAELSLKQIADKLNAEFTGDSRKLVFWYDDNAELLEDIESLELVGASIYRLEQDNQFRTKVFLEREDTANNYLIYAPFPKPAARDNHLEDMLLYSKRFYADRASLLMVDLGIGEEYKLILEKHIKFFAAKDRTQKFYDLKMESFSEDRLVVAFMSVLCKIRTVSFDEVLRVVLTDSTLVDNRLLLEFEKFDLLPAFWEQCTKHYGYSDVQPSLEKLVMTMFITYTERYLTKALPATWKPYVSYKSGDIIAFMNNLMNNVLCRERYDDLSSAVATTLNVLVELAKLPPEALVSFDAFIAADELLLRWITERLLHEDTGASLAGLDMPSLCSERRKMHYGERFAEHYEMLSRAYYVILAGKYTCPDDIRDMVTQYQKQDYRIDKNYRLFYYTYDQLDDAAPYESLRDLVENIYTNQYLFTQLPSWTSAFVREEALHALPLQRHFFNRFLRGKKQKTVVIISDALRYEVGVELCQKIDDDPNCTATMEAVMGVLPSYTRLGMASLLPHHALTLTDNYAVLVDGAPADSTIQREHVLQQTVTASRALQYDDLSDKKKAELRDILTGLDVVYVYHNQIDARGDKSNTEKEVFKACAEAIDEVYALVKRISANANVSRFIITADHGFIYKRDKLNESDKISGMSGRSTVLNRRYILADTAVVEDGVTSQTLGRTLGNNDERYVSFPISANVFKVSGGGQNYVHGGCSPQELLIPVIEVKTERAHIETHPAQIALVSTLQKITNLITSVDFRQTEAVSDTVKETSYRIYFIADDNERISNEAIYVADNKDTDPQKRMFRLRFDFKNKRYDRSKKYYLVAFDEKNNLEVFRHSVIMDIAFASDFGFNV